MEEIGQGIKVKNLDHLGIVAGVIDELGLVESIDALIPSERKVSNGTLIKNFINCFKEGESVGIFISVFIGSEQLWWGSTALVCDSFRTVGQSGYKNLYCQSRKASREYVAKNG